MKKIDIQDVLNNSSDLKKKKVGFISIVGRPNAGKSSFVNTLIGEKVSIISNTPQTTRKKILAIYNDIDTQIVFFDTPGIHKSEKVFNNEINAQAISSLNEADKILYFIDSSRTGGEEEDYIKTLVSNVKTPVIKVFTKSDLNPAINIQKDAFRISSLNGEGIEDLLLEIKKDLKEDICPYPDDYYTSQDMRFRISEIIREKLFLHTKEELPHSCFVDIEEIEDKKGLLRINAYIYTESDSQKYIVIGKNGSLISLIGKKAREELENIFGKKVFLALRAKVKKGWRKDEKLLKKMLG